MHLKEIFLKSIVEPNGMQRFLARKLFFRPMEWMGFHVVGDHFYEPIPNTRSLEKIYEQWPEHWPAQQKFDLPAECQNHVSRLRLYGVEAREMLFDNGFKKNAYFRMQDAVSLYSIMRELGIANVVEVGQGFSTIVMRCALAENAKSTGERSRFVSIDPFDRLASQGNDEKKEGVEIIKSDLQNVPLQQVIEALGPRSLLFIDSSHVFKPGSDVEYIFQRLLPEIPDGTLVHVHDIYTPYRTPIDRLVQDKLFFNEQDILENFLAFNASFSIKFPIFKFFSDSRTVNEIYSELGFPEDLPGNSFYFRKEL